MRTLNPNKTLSTNFFRRNLPPLILLGVLVLGAISIINSYVINSTADQIIPPSLLVATNDAGSSSESGLGKESGLGDESGLGESSSRLQELIDFDPDCILVLGAAVYNNRPSPMLEDRLLQGIELYKLGVSDRLLMSGDNGQMNYDEVNVMRSYAIAQGVPPEHVFMDHAGFSTYESVYRAQAIFQVERMIIVTQDYHLYRALHTANQLGIEAYGVPSNPREYMGQAARDQREVAARVKDFLYGITKPYPTYLGEEIPISGKNYSTYD